MKYYHRVLFSVLTKIFILSSAPYSVAQVASLEATLSLKTVDGVKVPFQNGFVVPTFEMQDRQIINLHGEWKKERFSANDNITLSKRDINGYQNLINEAAGRNLSSFDDSGWELKILPGVENTINPYPVVPEFYQDGVWYRKSFNVDGALAGKFIKLMFYSVNYVADVWINDVYLGYHEGGYTPFAFDVSAALNYGSSNVIAVRVDNPAWGSRNDIVPYTACDWFNYTGIIHDVYLEISEPVSVLRTNIVPQSVDGDIQSTVIFNNKSGIDKTVEVTCEVFKANVNQNNINSKFTSNLIGDAASITGTAQNTFTVKNDSVRAWKTNLTITDPLLWSPKNPNLYIMKVIIKEGSTVLDEYFTEFGIRTLKAEVDKVLLNGKPVFFPGIARHEDHPVFGRSIPTDSIYSDMLKVKNLNALMLRTAHYPNHVYTYQLADRLGIAVIEEIPVWWFDTALAWVIQNGSRHIHEQMFREMVFKDYNRPSVILWSTANECLDVNNRKTFITKVNQDLNFNYKDGRLITQSAAADRPGPTDDSQAACDVAGWTMYFGIFHGGTYYDGTRYFLGYANLAYPEKPILDTEYGYWSGELGGANGQQAQVNVFNETFNAFTFRASVIRNDGTYRDGGYLMGVTWWCIFDWYSHQHPSGFQSMGIYRMNRDTIKTVGEVMRNAYAPFYNVGGTLTNAPETNNNYTPGSFNVFQNFPNPFNPETTIKYILPSESFVKLRVYDILGNEVTSLINERRNAGNHELNFDANKYHLSSGIYFYRLETGNFSATRKMIYLK